MIKHKCRDCFHCVKNVYLIDSTSYFCRKKQKVAYPGTYGPGYRRGSDILLIDYPHKWDCWTSPDPEERAKRKTEFGFLEEYVREVK